MNSEMTGSQLPWSTRPWYDIQLSHHQATANARCGPCWTDSNRTRSVCR